MHGKGEGRLLGNGISFVVSLRSYFVKSYENISSLRSKTTRERKTRAVGCPHKDLRTQNMQFLQIEGFG